MTHRIDDPEATPTRKRQSEMELLCSDIGELKILCARVDDRSMQVLAKMARRDDEIASLRQKVMLLGLAPLVLSAAAFVLALVR